MLPFPTSEKGSEKEGENTEKAIRKSSNADKDPNSLESLSHKERILQRKEKKRQQEIYKREEQLKKIMR